jgi:DNA-binding PadR family transcriptional regulator
VTLTLAIQRHNNAVTFSMRRTCSPTERANFAVDIYIHHGYTHRVSSREIQIEDLLPLPEATFHILMAVAEDDRHGYAIIQEVATRTDGMLKLSAGTLYRSIQRMLEQGLIQETAERPAPELDDERRRYYRITAYGRAVANAEARRLAQLVRLARESGFVPGRA